MISLLEVRLLRCCGFGERSFSSSRSRGNWDRCWYGSLDCDVLCIVRAHCAISELRGSNLVEFRIKANSEVT
jgi:hypothetical protein